MTDIEKLRSGIDGISFITAQLKSQGDECEQLYLSRAIGLVEGKHTAPFHYQKKCKDSLTSLGAQVLSVSSLLLQVWSVLDKNLSAEQTRVEKFCSRVDLLEKRMGVRYVGYHQGRDYKQVTKIVKTEDLRVLPLTPDFTIDLYATAQRGIVPRPRLMRSMEHSRFVPSDHVKVTSSSALTAEDSAAVDTIHPERKTTVRFTTSPTGPASDDKLSRQNSKSQGILKGAKGSLELI